jgi:hypothetical protein
MQKLLKLFVTLLSCFLAKSYYEIGVAKLKASLSLIKHGLKETLSSQKVTMLDISEQTMR